MARCTHVRPDGTRCKFSVSPGRTLCYHHDPDFEQKRARARRKGGATTKARYSKSKEAPAPYSGTILDVMDAAGMTGPSWAPWRAFWKAVFALPMSEGELAVYRRHTERTAAPGEQVGEVWMPTGRRAGKSRNDAVGALFLAIRFDPSTLAPGEAAVVPVISADRKQGRTVLGYLKALFRTDSFRPYLKRVLKEAIELKNGVTIEVHTASYRSTRGYTIIGCICDEIAFWRADESSANPDCEILAALRPGMATVAGSLLLATSSPYAARGELYKAVERSFGRDDPHVLVWNADSLSMNPTLSPRVVERAFEEDPAAAASEYGRDGRVEFRHDVEGLFGPEAVSAVVARGSLELPRQGGTIYRAFTDPSGGSQDSFTLAIAHAEGTTAALDVVRERRPPFSPDGVVKEYAELLKSYGLLEVTGDRYAGEWPRERFREHGITYKPSERSKSELYAELVAPLNAGRVQLLDIPRLRAQLEGLERRVARSGKDSIDHAPGGHDDVANAVAGALGLALTATPIVWVPSSFGYRESMWVQT